MHFHLPYLRSLTVVPPVYTHLQSKIVLKMVYTVTIFIFNRRPNGYVSETYLRFIRLRIEDLPPFTIADVYTVT